MGVSEVEYDERYRIYELIRIEEQDRLFNEWFIGIDCELTRSDKTLDQERYIGLESYIYNSFNQKLLEENQAIETLDRERSISIEREMYEAVERLYRDQIS